MVVPTAAQFLRRLCSTQSRLRSASPFFCGVGVGVMGGESGDVVVVDELADVELDSVGCVSVSDSDKFDCSSMLFVELQ